MLEKVTLEFIGTIHTPFVEPKGTPITSIAGSGVKGYVEVFDRFSAGLRDIEGFSHLTLVYYMHRVTKQGLNNVPFMDDQPHGVFATRSPLRPNHIGMSIVRLLGVRGNIMDIQDLDIVDGTPLLDIKPYIPQVDSRTECRTGWFSGDMDRMKRTRDDGRYSGG